MLRKLAETLYGPSFDIKQIAEPLGIPQTIFKPIVNAYASASDLRPKLVTEDTWKRMGKKVVPVQLLH